MKNRIIYTHTERERIFDLMEVVMFNASGGFAEQAKYYAKHSILSHYEYGDNGLKTQIAYVLTNLQHWRGDLASKVKTELKKFQ